MLGPELTVASLLFLGTLFAAYVAWYLFRGRHLRRRKAMETTARSASARADKARNERPGEKQRPIGRDSYCYPKINDVMGYDFVNVVSVPEELTRPKTQRSRQDEPDKDAEAVTMNWNASMGMGLVTESDTAVRTGGSDRTRDENPSEDDTYPDRRLTDRKDDGNEDGTEEEINTIDIPADELQEIKNLENQDWPDNEENVHVSDELLRSMMDNPDIEIDDSATEEEILESERLRREHDAFQRQLDENPEEIMDRYIAYKDDLDEETISEKMDKEAAARGQND